jgi:hypothetical protein
MKRIQNFEVFESSVNEAEFSGRALKAQKFIELSIAVAEKFQREPDKVREVLMDHSMTYDTVKKLTDAVNKI